MDSYWKRQVISLICIVFVLHIKEVKCRNFYNYEELGAVPNINNDFAIAKANGELMNKTLNSLLPGDKFLVPSGKSFTLVGGILVDKEMNRVTIKIDGNLIFTNDRNTWPLDREGHIMAALSFRKVTRSLFTSRYSHGKGGGILDGNGKKWWGAISYLIHQEERPILLHFQASKEVIVENIYLKNPPFWAFLAEDSDVLTIRHVDVNAKWNIKDEFMNGFLKHDLVNLQAFNTDGFDVKGKNVHIHDCNIFNQDDCIAVKGSARDMLFERISCSGLGLAIGSIGSSVVSNITFRDCILPNTYKGIYIKVRWDDKSSAPLDVASITNILFENITMISPEQYAIWIGPAQQMGQPCDITWPFLPGSRCKMTGYQTLANITLKDVTIIDPLQTPGIIFGNATNPIQNLVFDNVQVKYSTKSKTDMSELALGHDWFVNNAVKECEMKGIDGYTLRGTKPLPPCFKSVVTPPYDPSIINLKQQQGKLNWKQKIERDRRRRNRLSKMKIINN